jgi:hypothetical protein
LPVPTSVAFMGLQSLTASCSGALHIKKDLEPAVQSLTGILDDSAASSHAGEQDVPQELFALESSEGLIFLRSDFALNQFVQAGNIEFQVEAIDSSEPGLDRTRQQLRVFGSELLAWQRHERCVRAIHDQSTGL